VAAKNALPRTRNVPVSASRHVSAVRKQDLGTTLEAYEIERSYGKNAGERLSTKLWVGDYCKEKEISKYAEQAEGIGRLGVLRMDVDNLGAAFVTGFSGEYNTLSRTATFSRQLSMFFKRSINPLLHDAKRAITIIYSGGDDMFLLGAWDDIVEAALEINKAFRRYTQGKLTVSAGIGMYPGKYPVHVMARETGELESHAKGKREGGAEKNAVTLFTPALCFGWEELVGQVIGKKLKLLEDFFQENKEKGNAFLYKILEYLQGVEEEEETKRAKISLARYAYLLAKTMPDTDDLKARERYKDFSQQMYYWIDDAGGRKRSEEAIARERKQLKAAIYLYLYSKRGKA